MAEIIFDLQDRVDPAANAPGSTTRTSAAAATTNAFQLRWFTLDFDQTTDKATSWQFPVPADYSSGGTVMIQWHSTPTSGNVVWKTSIYVATPGSSDIDTDAAFNTVDNFDVEAVPGTAGQFKNSSKALTSPGLAANRWAVLMVGRDANHASDDAAGDVHLISVRFSYTAA